MTTTAVERRMEVRSATPKRAIADLPSWPVTALFAGYAVWWVLGLAAFVVPIIAIVMLALLFARKSVHFPRGFYLWALFLLFVLGAAAEVGFGVRIVGYGVRVSNYVGSGVVFLYIYNCSRRTLSDRKIVFSMVWFFALIVVGGYLGVLMPRGHIDTPAQYLLPHAIASNEYVHTLVHPNFAEIQQPWGSPISFTRPSAPFPYTNGWGCNIALVLPFVMVALSMTRGRKRLAIGVLTAAALVPAFATLNRGMFIAVGFALVYAAIRYGLRGRVAPLAILVVGLTTVAIVAISTGVLTTLATRLQYSSTNVGRATIYQEAFDGALKSPLFGNGAPRPSEVLNISIGTQGQLWTILFSYGFVALAAYLGWFIYAAWRSRKATSNLKLWMHIVCLLALVTCVYYGYDGPQLAVAMVAAAVALRPPERRAGS